MRKQVGLIKIIYLPYQVTRFRRLYYDNENIHQLLKEKASEMRSISDEWQFYNYSQVKAKRLLEKWNRSENE